MAAFVPAAAAARLGGAARTASTARPSSSALFGTPIVAAATVAPTRLQPTMTVAPSAPTQLAVEDVVELLVPADQAAALTAEAATLPSVTLTDVDLQWVHVLSEGWASPLKGFMREDEYLQSLHFNCIRQPDGSLSNQSVPIVLAVDDAAKEAATDAAAIALKDPSGEVVAILRAPEFYEHNKEERVARSFGLTDARHPYAEIIYGSGDWLVGGDLQVLRPITYGDGLDEFRLTPRQLREEYAARGADAVFVFQLRNPIHNGHALLMTSCREQLLERGFKNPILLVHQIGGKVKGDDIPLAERIAQNKCVLAEGALDPSSTILGIAPSPMLYGGPTEVQWHAKSRVNAGCQYYIVGRDPAGMAHPNGERDMFNPWHGKKVLSMAPGLEKLEILPFRVAAFDKTVNKMAFFEPSRADDFVFISGSKMRKIMREGGSPPPGFMVPSGWQVLVDYYANLS